MLSSIGLKALGLFKNKKVWMGLMIIGLVVTIGGAFWYMQNRIESLTTDLANTETEVAQLNANNDALEQTVTKVEQRVDQVRAAQQRLNKIRTQTRQQLDNIRNQLGQLNLDQELERNPQQAIDQIKQIINEQLECIEYASGAQEAKCKSLN